MNKSYLEFLCDSLCNLSPGAQWKIDGDSYDGIVWLEKPVSKGGKRKPTEEEVNAEIERLQAEYNETEYQRQRAPEYPDLKEFADAYYWAQNGDNTKMNAYIVKCSAVKDKYPKSE